MDAHEVVIGSEQRDRAGRPIEKAGLQPLFERGDPAGDRSRRAMLRRGGRACLAGFLGGLAPVPDFNPLLQMSSGVHFR